MNKVTTVLKPFALALVASVLMVGGAQANPAVQPLPAVQDGTQELQFVQAHHRVGKRNSRRDLRRFNRSSRYYYSPRYGLRRGYAYRPYYYRPYGYGSRAYRYGYRY